MRFIKLLVGALALLFLCAVIFFQNPEHAWWAVCETPSLYHSQDPNQLAAGREMAAKCAAHGYSYNP
jgi:hypothetical protein